MKVRQNATLAKYFKEIPFFGNKPRGFKGWPLLMEKFIEGNRKIPPVTKEY
jgi:hypothetical protein